MALANRLTSKPLRYAFLGDLHHKKFIRMGEKSMSVEVKLTYQGKKYEIYRSTSETTLRESGVLVDAPNKKEVNNLIRQRLPFIDYLNCFIYYGDSSSILNSMNNNRKIDLVVKLYRLEWIDHYNITSKNKYENELKIIEELNEKKNKLLGTVDSLKDQIDKVPEEIRNLDLKDLQFKHDETNRWISNIQMYNKDIQSLQYKEDYKLSIQKEINEEGLQISVDTKKFEKITITEEEIEKMESVNQETKDLRNKIENIENETEVIGSSINLLVDRMSNLSESEKWECPTCKSIVDDREVKDGLLQEINDKIEAKKKRLEELKSKLAGLKNKLKTAKFHDINHYYKELNNKLRIKDNIHRSKVLISKNENKLTDLIKEIVDLKDKLETMSEYKEMDIKSLIVESGVLSNNLFELKKYIQLTEDITYKEFELKNIKSGIGSRIIKKEEILNYIEATKPYGKLYEVVLKSLVKEFSRDRFEITCESGVFRNNYFISLDVKMKVKNQYLHYDTLSSGQKTLCDIFFLYNIIPKVGLVVFDESFKHLDEGNHDLVIEYLSQITANNMIISTHSSGMNYGEKILEFSLDEDGNSIVNLN